MRFIKQKIKLGTAVIFIAAFISIGKETASNTAVARFEYNTRNADIVTLLGMLSKCNSTSPATAATAYEEHIEEYIIQRQDEFVFYDVPLDRQQQIYIQTVCRRYDIPYEIALGIMNTESGFDASAKNGNCYGIMQVHTISKKQYAEEFEKLGIYNLNSFYNGVEAGCFLFSKCKGENIEQRLIAYNEGHTAAAELFKKGVTSTGYSRKVLEYAKGLELSLP